MGITTVDSTEVRVVVVSLIALAANAIGLWWSLEDLQTIRQSRYEDMRALRERMAELSGVRAWRRVAFMVQATAAQLVILGGMVWCLNLPDGREQAEIKNWTFVILAVLLGTKAVVDLFFVQRINRYPYKGADRRRVQLHEPGDV